MPGNGRFRLLAPGRSHMSGWFGGGGNFEMGVLVKILGVMAEVFVFMGDLMGLDVIGFIVSDFNKLEVIENVCVHKEKNNIKWRNFELKILLHLLANP